MNIFKMIMAVLAAVFVLSCNALHEDSRSDEKKSTDGEQRSVEERRHNRDEEASAPGSSKDSPDSSTTELDQEASQQPPSNGPSNTNPSVSATVRDLTGLDGCKFVLQLDDGKKLEPTNLPDAFKVDGQKVAVKYQLQNDMGSICMIGQIVKILEIKKLD